MESASCTLLAQGPRLTEDVPCTSMAVKGLMNSIFGVIVAICDAKSAALREIHTSPMQQLYISASSRTFIHDASPQVILVEYAFSFSMPQIKKPRGSGLVSEETVQGDHIFQSS